MMCLIASHILVSCSGTNPNTMQPKEKIAYLCDSTIDYESKIAFLKADTAFVNYVGKYLKRNENNNLTYDIKIDVVDPNEREDKYYKTLYDVGVDITFKPTLNTPEEIVFMWQDEKFDYYESGDYDSLSSYFSIGDKLVNKNLREHFNLIEEPNTKITIHPLSGEWVPGTKLQIYKRQSFK